MISQGCATCARKAASLNDVKSSTPVDHKAIVKRAKEVIRKIEASGKKVSVEKAKRIIKKIQKESISAKKHLKKGSVAKIKA